MIFYFSATGNSKYVAERIAKATNDEVMYILDYQDEYAISDGENIGIVTPTYAWSFPSVVKDFFSKLKLNYQQSPYFFFVATFGFLDGFIGKEAQQVLKEQTGLPVSAVFNVRMPDNWTPSFDLSDPDKVAKQVADAEPQIDDVIEKIHHKKFGNFMKRQGPMFTASFMHKHYEKMRLTSNLSVSGDCIGCGLCAKKCPVQAIEIRDKKPVWVKEQCAMCLGCLHRCPKFVIQYGDGKTRAHGQYKHPGTKV